MNAGTRHYGMGKELFKNGVRLNIFTSSFNHKKLEETQKFGFFKIFKKEEIDGVNFIWIRTLKYKKNDGLLRVLSMFLFSFSTFFLCLFSRKFGSPDVIMASTPTLVPAFFASILSKLKRRPFILEIRDLWPETIVKFHPEKQGHILIKLFYKLELFCLHKADRIAGLLPGIPNYLDKLDLNLKKKFFWLPNGVESDILDVSLNTNSEVKKIVYAGALSKANAMESIINTADILKNSGLEFHIYGNGMEKADLLDLAKRKNLNHIYFHEPVPKKEVFNVISDADILIASLKDTDLYEYGISLNKIYDYMAIGKPVVFGVRAFNNPISEARAGVSVRPENAEEMADGIKEIVSMTIEQRNEMSIRARHYISKGHTFEILGSRLMKELKRLV
ncbi:glycosyltransferase family 4 protein [Fulvivirga lutea]|uniref:Glycosyltransferase family 4 protein n=1 Tax=Fulvivirga lutea TaxID=2810512 RepID=A0A974WER5_9BACT|nr:glycosyltransferase family 4 protein [Fulvivirga lutea]QSE96796.1 glycosyltransferase family 4 protein [Fulvivirga lutea]